MKVRIIRSTKGLWYYDLIGECLIVKLHENGKLYETIHNDKIKGIYIHHCKNIIDERYEKLNRTLNDTDR
jgi:hypothetical protein